MPEKELDHWNDIEVTIPGSFIPAGTLLGRYCQPLRVLTSLAKEMAWRSRSSDTARVLDSISLTSGMTIP